MRFAHPRKLDHWPRLWLMTDARNDAGLERAIGRLPRGAGIVFRHYHLDPAERQVRLHEVRRLAKRHGLLLFAADAPRPVDIDGIHLRRRERRTDWTRPHSAAVHDVREWRHALARRVDLIFLSPVFATRSHPGARAMPLSLTKRLIAASPCPVILLGGMTAGRFRRLAPLGAYGWAGIDALR